MLYDPLTRGYSQNENQGLHEEAVSGYAAARVYRAYAGSIWESCRKVFELKREIY